ncbi:MAG: hypothetical protein KBG49_07430 [Spirochaetes bacterium]|nr:hypothetical protein [Spirochaetota bacterium]
MYIPSREEFIKGCEEFEKHEKRDSMYKVSMFLVTYFWGRYSDMADGLGVLLLTWNQAFYRYGVFDFDKLEKSIADNFKQIESFRRRTILSLSTEDENGIENLFKIFLDTLQIDSGKMKGRKSPVAVAKALHLLAPCYFPLWDNKIAQAYGCNYNENPEEKYVSFCKITKEIAGTVKNYFNEFNKTLPKLIDEYNYSKYTKKWI